MLRRRQLQDLRPIPLWRGGDIAEVCGNIGAQPDHLGPLLCQCLYRFCSKYTNRNYVDTRARLTRTYRLCEVLRPTGSKGTLLVMLMVPRWDLNTYVCNPSKLCM